MNEAIQSEETARRILQNQRTILEQNAKILAFQETLTTEKESTANAKSVVPAIVKVSSNYKNLGILPQFIKLYITQSTTSNSLLSPFHI